MKNLIILIVSLLVSSSCFSQSICDHNPDWYDCSSDSLIGPIEFVSQDYYSEEEPEWNTIGFETIALMLKQVKSFDTTVMYYNNEKVWTVSKKSNGIFVFDGRETTLDSLLTDIYNSIQK